MKVEILALLAVFLYGTQNVLLERFVIQYGNIISFQLWFNASLFLCAGLVAFANKAAVVLPPIQIFWAMFLGFVFFIADYCILLAYAKSGSAFLVGSVMTTMPIFIGLVSYIFLQKLPTMPEVLGTGLMVSGVLVYLLWK